MGELEKKLAGRCASARGDRVRVRHDAPPRVEGGVGCGVWFGRGAVRVPMRGGGQDVNRRSHRWMRCGEIQIASEREAEPLAERGGFGVGRIIVIEGWVHGSE